MGEAIVIAMLVVLLLVAYFHALKVEWPESYFSVEDYVSQRASRNPIAFVTSRFIPPAVGSAAVSAWANALGVSALWPVVVLVMAHIGLTFGRDLVERARRGRLTRHWWTSRSVIIALLVAVMVIASFAGGLLARSMPSFPALVQSLTTALIAAILATYFLSRTAERAKIEDGVRESAEQLGSVLLDKTRACARKYQCDENILLAIVLTEAMQRPRWYRWLEHRAATVKLARTVGLAQRASDAGEFDAIEQCARTIAGKVRPGLHHLPAGWVAAVSELVNPGERYAALVESAIYAIDAIRTPVTSVVGSDGQPVAYEVARWRNGFESEIILDVSVDFEVRAPSDDATTEFCTSLTAARRLGTSPTRNLVKVIRSVGAALPQTLLASPSLQDQFREDRRGMDNFSLSDDLRIDLY